MATYPPQGNYPPPPPRVRFETIGEAWRWFQQQMGVWIGAILIAGVGYLAVSMLANLVFTGTVNGPNFQNWNTPEAGAKIGGGIAALLVEWFVEYALYAGLFTLALRQIRGQPISIGDMFSVGGVVLR